MLVHSLFKTAKITQYEINKDSGVTVSAGEVTVPGTDFFAFALTQTIALRILMDEGVDEGLIREALALCTFRA